MNDLCFQIYNEMIRDLLNPSLGILDLREDAKGGVQVAGLSEVTARSTDEVSTSDTVVKGLILLVPWTSCACAILVQSGPISMCLRGLIIVLFCRIHGQVVHVPVWSSQDALGPQKGHSLHVVLDLVNFEMPETLQRCC